MHYPVYIIYLTLIFKNWQQLWILHIPYDHCFFVITINLPDSGRNNAGTPANYCQVSNDTIITGKLHYMCVCLPSDEWPSEAPGLIRTARWHGTGRPRGGRKRRRGGGHVVQKGRGDWSRFPGDSMFADIIGPSCFYKENAFFFRQK